jgi:hypothetical protein
VDGQNGVRDSCHDHRGCDSGPFRGASASVHSLHLPTVRLHPGRIAHQSPWSPAPGPSVTNGTGP